MSIYKRIPENTVTKVKDKYTTLLRCIRPIIFQYLLENRDIALPSKSYLSDVHFSATNWIKDSTTDVLAAKVVSHPSNLYLAIHTVVKDMMEDMMSVVNSESSLPLCLAPYNTSLSCLLCHICDVVKTPPYISMASERSGIYKTLSSHITEISLLTEDILLHDSWIDVDSLDRHHGKVHKSLHYRTLSYEIVKEFISNFYKNYIDTDPKVVTSFSYFRFIIALLALLAKIWNFKYLRMCKNHIRELQEMPFTLAYFKMLDYYLKDPNQVDNELKENIQRTYSNFAENSWLQYCKPIDILVLSIVEPSAMFKVGKDIFSYIDTDTKKSRVVIDDIRPEIYFLFCTYILKKGEGL